MRPLEPLCDRIARRGAEDRQRAVLGGDDRRGEIDLHVIRTAGSHQRELIQRQLPSHAARRHEREAVHVATLDVLDQPVQRLIHATVVDRDRVLVARNRVGAERQHERVILDRLTGLGVNSAPLGVDVVQLVDEQLGARVVDDLSERVTTRRRVGERLADRHRAIDELLVGCDHRYRGLLRRELPQGQRRLQGGDSSAHDHYAKLGMRAMCCHGLQANSRPHRRQPQKSAVVDGKLRSRSAGDRGPAQPVRSSSSSRRSKQARW